MKQFLFLGHILLAYSVKFFAQNDPVIVRSARCIGKPYTQTPVCAGWNNITFEQCEAKCAGSLSPPNRPSHTCVAAAYYNGTASCHLYESCDELEDFFSATSILKDVPEDDDDEEEDYGPYAELGLATMAVLVNLTNFTGLISDGTKVVNVTHHFGAVRSDLDLFYDMTSGFIEVLQAGMLGTDGKTFCPFKDASVIKECLDVAMCLVQLTTPKYITLEMFAGLMEQKTRFDDITWPTLKTGIMSEGGDVLDKPLPEFYRCDGIHTSLPYENSYKMGSLVQIQSKEAQATHAATFATSKALDHATRAMHHVLDSHGTNSSFDLAAKKLSEVWKPVCQEIQCDHENYWDILLASHRQTMALIETGATEMVALEIKSRVVLDTKTQNFLAKTSRTTGMHRFFDSEGRQQSNSDAAKQYGEKSRVAFKKFLKPVVLSLAKQSKSRALRVVSQVEFAKFVADRRMSLLAVNSTADDSLDSASLDSLDDAGRRRKKWKKAAKKKTKKTTKTVAKDIGKDIQKATVDKARAATITKVNKKFKKTTKSAKKGIQDTSESLTNSANSFARCLEQAALSANEVLEQAGEHTGNLADLQQAREDIDKCYDQARGAAVEVKQTAVKTYYGVRGTLEEILAFIKGLFNCFGTLSEWAALGYSYEVVKGKVAFNIGMGMGAAPDLETNIHGMIGGSIGDASAPTVPDLGSVRSAMTDDEFYRLVLSLIQFKMPNLGMWVSLDLSLGIGAASTYLWSGIGIGASLSCWVGCAAQDVTDCDGSCTVGLSVGAILSAWVEMFNCPAYALLASKPEHVTCTRSFGVTFLTMCCGMDIITGANNCR